MQKGKKWLAGLVLAILAFAVYPVAWGDENEALQRKNSELSRIERDFEKYSKTLTESRTRENSNNKGRLNRVLQGIEEGLIEFDTYKKNQEATAADLQHTREKITTLSGQLQVLEAAYESTQKEVEVIKIQILKRVAELQYLMEEADLLKAERESQKDAVVDFFSLLQTQNETFAVNDDARNILRLLLSDSSFSENLWQEEQIQATEQVGRKIFHDIETSEDELAKVTKLVNDENKKLNELHTRKNIEENNLRQQVEAKKALLAAVQNNEAEYEKMLEESKQQMRQTAIHISELLADKQSIERTIELLDKEYNRQLIKQSEAEDIPYQVGERFLAEDAEKKFFAWPVAPKKGISAYFHDASYKDVFHVTHEAIDIPAPQGTEVLAPALGYVYKITDNGMGYSSIILAHRDNFMTVYGHVSKFLVKEGQLVATGTPIALSGGTPGTVGAGWMTTGPHLHFEVIKNGKHIDPLQFLPIQSLPPGTIAEEFVPKQE